MFCINNRIGPVIILRKTCLWIERVFSSFFFFVLFGPEACLETLWCCKFFFHNVLSMITMNGRTCNSYQVAVFVLMVIAVYQNDRSKFFCKIAVLKFFSKLTEKHLQWRHFLRSWMPKPATLLKISRSQVFSCLEIFTNFLIEHIQATASAV